MSVTAYEREVRGAQRQQQFDEAYELDRQFVDSFMHAHRQVFTEAQPPLVEAVPVDRVALARDIRTEALKGIALYKLGERRKVKEAAALRAQQEADRLDAERAAKARVQRLRYAQAWEKLLANDPVTVMTTLEEAFEDNESPAAALNCEGSSVTVLMRFPDISGVVPETRAEQTPTGRPSVKSRTKTERNNLYGAALLSHAVATVKEAFAVAPAIASVNILVIAADEAESDTPTLTPLYCARFERSSLDGVDWENEEAAAIAERVPGLLEMKGRTHEISPIDLRGEPDLRSVVEQIANDLGWTVDPRSR